MAKNFTIKKLFENWKREEEKILRDNGFSEEAIKELRAYDWEIVKKDRVYNAHNIPWDFGNYNMPVEELYDMKELLNDIDIETILLNIESEKLRVALLENERLVDISILVLKGYSKKEIAKILNISDSNLRVYLHRIRKMYEKF